jgi:hypothetical protein
VNAPPLIADRPWTVTAAIAGPVGLVSYALLIAVPAPEPLQVALTFGFAGGLALSAAGLHLGLLAPRTPRLGLVAAGSTVVATALMTAMILLQIAIQMYAPRPERALVAIWLGLDVAWDLYIGVATLLFGLCFLRHPAFGRWLGWPGIVVALVLLVLNTATFPEPPVEVGLFDAGPFVALWYLVVFVRVAVLLVATRRAPVSASG